jgi:CRP-like cAMP-binding protein
MCDEVSLDKGEALFDAGEVGDSMVRHRDGEVEVVRGGVVIARLGEESASARWPRSTGSRAARPCARAAPPTCCGWSGRLMDLLTDYPELVRSLARVLVERIRRTA